MGWSSPPLLWLQTSKVMSKSNCLKLFETLFIIFLSNSWISPRIFVPLQPKIDCFTFFTYEIKINKESMNKLFKMLLLVCGFAFMLTACSVDDNNENGNGEATGLAKYTIMIYGCGGSNVDWQVDGAIEDIAKALNVSNNQVRVTVMYSMSKDISTHKTYDPSVTEDHFYGEFGKTYRYELTKDFTKYQMDLNGFRKDCFYKNASEVELYKQSTLVDYIKWAKQTAPAENYILMPTNHGGGFDLDHEVLTRGIAYDDNHGNKSIAIKTIAEALKETGKIKAIYWYGCLMGQLEVLTEVAPYCDYQFASSHVARIGIEHINGIINAINATPNDFEAAIKMQGKIIEGVNSSFLNVPDIKDQNIKHNYNCDFGCWRSDKLAAINTQVKALAELLIANYATAKDKIDAATQYVYLFENDCPYVDLIDYTNLISNYLETNQAQSIASAVKTAYDAATVYRFCGVNTTSADGTYSAPVIGDKSGYSIGISIYAKDERTYTKYGANYKASAFDAATGWSNWYAVNEIPVAYSKTNPCNDPSWETFWLEDEDEDEE